MPTIETASSSFVCINKHLNGYSWNVQVAAVEDTPEALRAAKTVALEIWNELEADLNTEPAARAF